MRLLFAALGLLMLLFAAVQFNDPDGWLWMLVYLVPAVWAGIALWRRRWFPGRYADRLLILSIVAALGGVLYYWPRTPQWWTPTVWYEVESAREGLGMMIVAAVLLIILAGTRRPLS